MLPPLKNVPLFELGRKVAVVRPFVHPIVSARWSLSLGDTALVNVLRIEFDNG